MGCRSLNLDCAECPYKQNQLVHEEEFQAWEILMASLGQIRVSPSGRIIGLDMAAALSITAGRGYDVAAVSELLQEAEATLIPLLNEAASEEHG